ncbi:MAG: hypothetical protein ACPL4K_02925 [Candidatus Margulisiibacteriota bacterium]
MSKPVALTYPQLPVQTTFASPIVFEAEVLNDLKAGSSSSWAVINFSGLKYINDNLVGGHKAGDAYLQTVQEKLEFLSRSFFGDNNIRVAKDGPNFAVRLAHPEKTLEFLAKIQETFKNGVTFNYKHKEKIITQTYTAETEGRSSIINLGVLTYDRSLLSNGKIQITEGGIYCGLREEIYYLNRREINSERSGQNHIIGPNEAAVLESYRLQERLLDFGPRIEVQQGRNIEPKSRLYNAKQMTEDAVGILESGRAVHFAFIDINATSTFRSLGFAGEIMIDAIVEERIAQAAAILPKGITIYRHGRGSEEFYLLADSTKVTSEKFEQAAKRFIKALNEAPLRVLIELEALKKTEMGRQYLAEHPELKIQKLKLSNGKIVDVVPVDIRKIVRKGPDGRKYRGITVTMGIGTFDHSLKLDRETDPNDRRRPMEILFDSASHAIMEQGEIAKKKNPERKNVLLAVEFANGKPIAKTVPLFPAAPPRAFFIGAPPLPPLR